LYACLANKSRENVNMPMSKLWKRVYNYIFDFMNINLQAKLTKQFDVACHSRLRGQSKRLDVLTEIGVGYL
jgi:hypothetical protein